MTVKNINLELEEKFELKNDFEFPSFDEWKKAVESELKGADFQKKMLTKTYEGITLKPIYIKADLENLPSVENFPSFANCVRGNIASGYVKNSWLISQHVDSDIPKKMNEIILNDLQKGADSINIILKDASRISVTNLEEIFYGINLENYPAFIRIGEPNLKFVKTFLEYADKNKLNKSLLKGGIIADPISILLKKGYLIDDIQKIYSELTEILRLIRKSDLHLKSIGVSGLPFHNAGASAVQELAYLLSSAVEYVNNLQEKGAELKDIFSSVYVSIGVASNYFMEISKVRALRILWSNLLKAYKLDIEDLPVFIHAETSRTNQTICDPHVNLLRTTTEAFSAIAGGVDSLQINPFDDVYESVNDFSRRLARNQHIILKDEAHLDKVIDPAGGSYFVESLTSEIAAAAWKEFQEIQNLGGLTESLKKNIVQTKILEVVTSKAKDIKTRKNILVGTNMYANPNEENIVSRVISVNQVSNDNGNIYANQTVIKINPLHQFRPAVLFEELRTKAEKYFTETGFKPKVFLFNMGALKQFKARADFSRAFFELGGFEIIYNNGFNSVTEAVNEFKRSEAKVAVICSTDETYPELVPQLLDSIEKDKCVKVLAGYPKEQVEMHKQNGIDEFIYLGCDAYETLDRIFKMINEKTFSLRQK